MAVGDVTVKGAEDREYTLNFGVNAMCRLEEMDPEGRRYREILHEMRAGNPSIRTIRLVVAAGLVKPQDQTLDQVGEIIEDIGGISIILRAFQKSDDAIVESVTDTLIADQQRATAPIVGAVEA